MLKFIKIILLVGAMIGFVPLMFQLSKIFAEPVKFVRSLEGHEPGDIAWAKKYPYWFGTPQRGDLVATRHEIYGFEIGRVIGLPGDRVVMDTESILVNQQLLGEPYISNTARFLDEWQGVLGEGEYFVIWASTLGDNLWRGSAVSERKIVGRL